MLPRSTHVRVRGQNPPLGASLRDETQAIICDCAGPDPFQEKSELKEENQRHHAKYFECFHLHSHLSMVVWRSRVPARSFFEIRDNARGKWLAVLSALAEASVEASAKAVGWTGWHEPAPSGRAPGLPENLKSVRKPHENRTE